MGFVFGLINYGGGSVLNPTVKLHLQNPHFAYFTLESVFFPFLCLSALPHACRRGLAHMTQHQTQICWSRGSCFTHTWYFNMQPFFKNALKKGNV